MIKVNQNKFKKVYRVPWVILTISLLLSCSKSEEKFRIDFGLLGQNENEMYVESRTNIIPYVVGRESQSFGIVITPVVEQKYSTYTVITFPQLTQINMEDKTKESTVDKVTTPIENVSGAFVHYYWLENGDPLGVYKVEVYINNKKLKTIEFEVVLNEA